MITIPAAPVEGFFGEEYPAPPPPPPPMFGTGFVALFTEAPEPALAPPAVLHPKPPYP